MNTGTIKTKKLTAILGLDKISTKIEPNTKHTLR